MAEDNGQNQSKNCANLSEEREQKVISNTSDGTTGFSNITPNISNEEGNISDVRTGDGSKELYLITKNYPSRDNFIEGLTLIKLTKSNRDLSCESLKNKRIQEIIVESYDLKVDDKAALKLESSSGVLPKSNISESESKHGQIFSNSHEVDSGEIEIKKNIIYDDVKTNEDNPTDTENNPVVYPCNLRENKIKSVTKHSAHGNFMYKTSCSCGLKKTKQKEASYPTYPSNNNSSYSRESLAYWEKEKLNSPRKVKRRRRKKKITNLTVNKKIKSNEDETVHYETSVNTIDMILWIFVKIVLVATVLILLNSCYCVVNSKQAVAHAGVKHQFIINNSLGSELDGVYNRIFTSKEISMTKDKIVFRETHIFIPKGKIAQNKLRQEFAFYEDNEILNKIIENLTSNKTK